MFRIALIAIVTSLFLINGSLSHQNYQSKVHAFFHRNVNGGDTEVYAKDGIVTLRGKGTSQTQKDMTTEYARGVDGVKKVKIKMIAGRAPETPGKKTMGETMDTVIESIDDASITALVRTSLLYHHSTSGLSTTVETKDGVVRLNSATRSAAGKDLSTKFASEVHGLKSVVNSTTVE